MDAAVGGRSCMNRVSSNYGTLKWEDGALLGIGKKNAPRTHVESRLQAGCILCHTRLAGSAGCLELGGHQLPFNRKSSPAPEAPPKNRIAPNAKQRLAPFWAVISPAISSL